MSHNECSSTGRAQCFIVSGMPIRDFMKGMLQRRFLQFAFVGAALLLATGCEKLFSSGRPSELVSFGYVRPVACKTRGPITYSCVMRNHSSSPRDVFMECAGFDSQGRMIGDVSSINGLRGVLFQPHEERIVTVPFLENGARTLVCVDTMDSMLPYEKMRELVSNAKRHPTAHGCLVF